MALAIAQAGGGSYIHTDNTTRLVNALEKDLNTLPKAAIGSINRAGYIEHYMPWAIAALILLILELFISQRRSTLWTKLIYLVMTKTNRQNTISHSCFSLIIYQCSSKS